MTIDPKQAPLSLTIPPPPPPSGGYSDRAQTADEMLGRDFLSRLQALSVAASHRREAFLIGRKEDGEGEYDGAIARQVLADAQIYHAWLTEADGAA